MSVFNTKIRKRELNFSLKYVRGAFRLFMNSVCDVNFELEKLCWDQEVEQWQGRVTHLTFNCRAIYSWSEYSSARLSCQLGGQLLQGHNRRDWSSLLMQLQTGQFRQSRLIKLVNNKNSPNCCRSDWRWYKAELTEQSHCCTRRKIHTHWWIKKKKHAVVVHIINFNASNVLNQVS